MVIGDGGQILRADPGIGDDLLDVIAAADGGWIVAITSAALLAA